MKIRKKVKSVDVDMKALINYKKKADKLQKQSDELTALAKKLPVTITTEDNNGLERQEYLDVAYFTNYALGNQIDAAITTLSRYVSNPPSWTFVSTIEVD